MIAMPIWLNITIGIAVVFAFFFAGRFSAYAISISPNIPKPLREDGISRIHTGVHVMGHFSPNSAKIAVFRARCSGFIAFLGIFMLTLQTQRADAKILVGIFTILTGCQVALSYRKLRRLAPESAAMNVETRHDPDSSNDY